MPGQILRRVHGRQKREGSLLWVSVALVIDVVENQTVKVQRLKALDRHVGDLLALLRGGRSTWRCQREEQNLAPTFGDAPLKIHAATVTDPSAPSDAHHPDMPHSARKPWSGALGPRPATPPPSEMAPSVLSGGLTD